MSFGFTISRLLMALAVVGLISGAYAAPVKGNSVIQTEDTVMSGASMDCCDPPAAPADCRDMQACSFGTLCIAKVLQTVAVVTDVERTAMWISTTLLDDQQADGLSSPPLDPPPKA
jgi:hypothetical protein